MESKSSKKVEYHSPLVYIGSLIIIIVFLIWPPIRLHTVDDDDMWRKAIQPYNDLFCHRLYKYGTPTRVVYYLEGEVYKVNQGIGNYWNQSGEEWERNRLECMEEVDVKEMRARGMIP